MRSIHRPLRKVRRTCAWQRRRARYARYGFAPLGLLAADLNGDDIREVIAADAAAAGYAVLCAYRGDGSTVWEHPFVQIPGALPVWNVGALTFWWPGQLRAPGTVDLFVNTRRGLMHSDNWAIASRVGWSDRVAA